MEINVIGRSADWPGNPGLLEEEHVSFHELPSFGLNVVRLFTYFREVKKCMVLCWSVDEQSARRLGPWPRFMLLPAIRLIVKKPGGPSILVRGDARWADTFRSIADVVDDRKRSHRDVMKEAYFLAECGHPSSIYREPMQRERLEWLKRNVRGSVLEVGCATGYVLNYVGGGVGIDVDELRLEYARRTYPANRFVHGDAARMPFGDREFDTVMIPDILEHVELEHAAEIVREALRVGKSLLVTVPNAAKPNYDEALVENPEHKWFPTADIMRSIVGDDARIDFSENEDFIYVSK